MRKIQYVQWVALTLSALTMGVLWGTWFSLSRSMSQLTPEVFLSIGQTIIHNLSMPMRILMPLTVASLSLLLFLKIRSGTKRPWIVGASLVLMLGVLIITIGVEVPMDNQIKTWSISQMPTNWTAIRDRWEVHHTIRTFLAIASFCLLAWDTAKSRTFEHH
jgi:uncharacterized membrane protein